MRRAKKFAFFSLFLSVLLLCFFLIFLRTRVEKPKINLVSETLPELVISTYQSWIAEEGLGKSVISEFERRYACKVRVMISADGGSLLSRLEMDFRRPHSQKPHVVVGIDQYLWHRAQVFAEDWGEWRPQGYLDLPSHYRKVGFLPYSVGALTWMLDSQEQSPESAPHSLMDLLHPRWKRKLILQDPRTSTPGLVFILYSFTVLGEPQAVFFWSKLRDQWLTLPQSWDAAYSMFLRHQAPLVWSYVTSQAYHEQHAQPHYRALPLKEGQPLQIEGAFLVKNSLSTSKHKELARQFLEFLLSPEVQTQVPQKHWMFPVRTDVELPLSYHGIPHPFSMPMVSLPLDQKTIQRVTLLWREAVGAGR